MFQFGILATHLPHLIIAAAYMIYFGVCAFDPIPEDEDELQAVEIQWESASQDLQIYATVGFYDVIQDAAFQDDKTKILAYQRLANKEIFHFFEEPLYDRYPGSNIFSRPPPSC